MTYVKKVGTVPTHAPDDSAQQLKALQGRFRQLEAELIMEREKPPKEVTKVVKEIVKEVVEVPKEVVKVVEKVVKVPIEVRYP